MMLKTHAKTIIIVLFMTFIAFFSTNTAVAQFLQYVTKDSLNGQPRINSALIGRLKLNGFYDIAGNLYGQSSFLIHENNVFGKNIPGFWVDMRQSQIRFRTTAQLKNGKEISSMLEADFEGGPNRTSLFRLRHAWVKYDHWMLGQNWSNFGDASLWPASLLDWDGPTGMVLSRRIQIRYSNSFGRGSKSGFEVSLEQMEPRRLFDYTTNTDYGVDFAPRRIPDFVGGLRRELHHGGFLKLAGLYRNIGYDSRNANLSPASEFNYKSVSGWGVTAITSIFFDKKSGLTNNLQAQWTIGKGIADYFLAVGGSGLDGFPVADKVGILNLLPVNAGFVSYQRFWTQHFHTMVIGSYNHFTDGASTISPWDEMTNYQFTLNLSYNVLSNLMLGLEPQIGYKELKLHDGNTVGKNAVRINFGMLFNF